MCKLMLLYQLDANILSLPLIGDFPGWVHSIRSRNFAKHTRSTLSVNLDAAFVLP